MAVMTQGLGPRVQTAGAGLNFQRSWAWWGLPYGNSRTIFHPFSHGSPPPHSTPPTAFASLLSPSANWTSGSVGGEASEWEEGMEQAGVGSEYGAGAGMDAGRPGLLAQILHCSIPRFYLTPRPCSEQRFRMPFGMSSTLLAARLPPAHAGDD